MSPALAVESETRARQIKSREISLQRALSAWIVTGLVFMLLPGTFLGVWNLLSISSSHSVAHLDMAWLQAHGHAQVFGWIGTFIIGIGFYSLSKMGNAAPFAMSRVWVSWFLWTGGVALRWTANIYGWQWRVALPLSAALELAAFLLFVVTVSSHRPGAPASEIPVVRAPKPLWMKLVISSTLLFMAALAGNFMLTVRAAVTGEGPAVSIAADQRLLAMMTWGFPVLAIWGFNARWLPIFLGLAQPVDRWLRAALILGAAAVVAALAGQFLVFAVLALAGGIAASYALNVFTRPVGKPKTQGVHASFPSFIRVAYIWLLIAGALSVFAAEYDRAGGAWGASRHALTVGFIAAMIFAIGQRVLPAFCGARVLFSPKLMLASLLLLNVGCVLRVTSEVGAYEGYVPALWSVLPVSAVIEMAAVTVFAINLAVTLMRPPAHLQKVANQPE